jgi:methionine biosynthesis protein MetW
MTSTAHDSEMRLTSYTGARPDVTGMLGGSPSRVLDIGCSDGSLAATLKERGTEVWGIELDPEFAARATQRIDRVLQGDALERTAELVEAGEQFEAVICADCLEHMVSPDQVLSNVRKLVANDGQCIVSLPNVRFYTTFTNLGFRGRWPMNDRGVHDRTHLRWFTDRNARDLFASCDFVVEDFVTHYRITDLPHPKNRCAKYLAFGPWAPFLAYQYVYRLRPSLLERSVTPLSCV